MRAYVFFFKVIFSGKKVTYFFHLEAMQCLYFLNPLNTILVTMSKIVQTAPVNPRRYSEIYAYYTMTSVIRDALSKPFLLRLSIQRVTNTFAALTSKTPM